MYFEVTIQPYRLQYFNIIRDYSILIFNLSIIYQIIHAIILL